MSASEDGSEEMNASTSALQRFLASLAASPGEGVADAQLIDQFLARRAEAASTAQAADQAFEELVVRHGQMVRDVCRRILDDPGDADDAFQATFLVLFRRAGALRVGGSLGPWLHGVARRVAFRARADRARRGAREGRVEKRPGQDPAVEASRAEILSVIDEEVGRLPERYRAPVVLCLLEGLSYEEAARRLACPPATVGVQLSRGRELLRKRLRRRGVAPASAAVAVALATDHTAIAGRLVRAAFDAERVTSPRVAELARREIRSLFALKSGVAAIIASAVIVIAGGAARVAGKSAAEDPARKATPVAQGDPEPAGAGPDADLPAAVKELVENHERQLNRIRSLKCVIEMRSSDDAGKTWKTMSRTLVRRSGPKERVHTQQFWIRDRDKIVPLNSHTDVLLSPDGILSMMGYDPEHPPLEPISPREQAAASSGRISGLIRAAEPVGPWGYKGGLAADCLALFLPDPRYSLRDLCRATPKVTPVSRRDDHGRTVQDLMLKSPDGKIAYVVSLSPDHGYAIVETKTSQTANGTELKSAKQVVEFQEPAPGIFIPKTLRQSMSWASAIVIETVIRDVAVNGTVADADLAFRFPAGIGVSDLGKNVYYAWADGVPARTFKTVDEFNEWTFSQLNAGARPGREIAGKSSVTGQLYSALVLEFEANSRLFVQSAKNAKTDAERRQAVIRLRNASAAFVERLLELARQDSSSPLSLQALARAATLSGSEEAIELLKKNWAANPAIAEVILQIGLSASFPAGTEALLREVLARNPSLEARGHAAFALASVLFSLSDVHRFHAAKPKEVDGLERRYGKRELERILARDSGTLLREAEDLMRRVANDYADVKLHLDRPKDTQTLGQLARTWQGQHDEPAIGKAAPAIDAKDLNGQTVRLSDYRGKVVVVFFWASWCAPCMASIPEEKALLRRLADKPFVLLGVSCEGTAGEARKVVARHSIPWTNVHDGVPSEGKLAERFGVAGHGIPAIFVIDRQGVLRHKWVRSSEELGRLVDALIAEDGASRK